MNIGVLGNVDTGKSSLIGVLKTNQLDDGKGSIRKSVMKHNHEIESGRTSCISYNNIEINDNLFTFIDLAGHEKYLKTTIYGLSGLNMNYIILLIGANMGINHITKEHFSLASALNLPIILVINKIDLAPENILNNTYRELKKLIKLKTGGRKHLTVIENEDMINNLDEHKKIFFDGNNIHLNKENIENIKDYNEILETKRNKIINIEKDFPIFLTSNKTGYGLDNLKEYLKEIYNRFNINIEKSLSTEKQDIDNKFIIQETYSIAGIGLVFYGFVKSGVIKKNDKLNIGPFQSKFYQISIRNVRNILDKDVEQLKKHEYGCIAIKQLDKSYVFRRLNIRKGMYITSKPFCCNEFIARVHILHHPTTIKENYQSTIHCGTVIQAATIQEIINIKNSCNYNDDTDTRKLLRSGDLAKVRFKFMFRPEFIEKDSMFIFRENMSKGVGRIISTI